MKEAIICYRDTSGKNKTTNIKYNIDPELYDFVDELIARGNKITGIF